MEKLENYYLINGKEKYYPHRIHVFFQFPIVEGVKPYIIDLQQFQIQDIVGISELFMEFTKRHKSIMGGIFMKKMSNPYIYNSNNVLAIPFHDTALLNDEIYRNRYIGFFNGFFTFNMSVNKIHFFFNMNKEQEKELALKGIESECAKAIGLFFGDLCGLYEFKDFQMKSCRKLTFVLHFYRRNKGKDTFKFNIFDYLKKSEYIDFKFDGSENTTFAISGNGFRYVFYCTDKNNDECYLLHQFSIKLKMRLTAIDTKFTSGYEIMEHRLYIHKTINTDKGFNYMIATYDEKDKKGDNGL